MPGRFSIEAHFKAVDAFSSIVGKIASNSDKMMRSLGGSVKEMNGWINKGVEGLTKLAVTAAAVGVGAGAALFKIGQTGAEFEQAITNVGAVSLMTRKEVADLEKEARRLGSTIDGFGFTATEVAGAMELMGKAGFSNKEIIQSIGGVLSAAAAEGMDLSEAAGLVSNTLKGMGLEASQTGRVADVLALASARTNSSISSLGESLSIASSTARQFNIPLEDITAMAASLQDVGLDASTTGTALVTMLSRIAAPTKEMTAQMRAMGISFQNAHGDMLKPAAVMQQLVKAGEKAGGNMKQVAFFTDLVGLRGAKGAENLKDLFKAGKVQTLTGELERAHDIAEKMAAIKMNTFQGDLKLLSNAADDIKISLFDLNSGPLRDVVQGVTAWINANKGLIVQDVQGFIKGISDNLPAIEKWGTRIGKMAAVFGAVALGIKAVAAAQWLWNAALAANPISLIILAIAAVVATVIAFWPEISAFFSRVWAGIKEIATSAADTVVGVVKAIWEPVKGFLRAALEIAIGLFSILFPGVIPAAKLLFEFIGESAAWLMTKWEPIKEFFAGLWKSVSGAFATAWGVIANVAGEVFKKVKAIWEPIGAFFSELWDGIANAFKHALGWAIEKIESMVEALRKIGHDVLGGGDGHAPGETPAGEGDAPPVPQIVPPRATPAAGGEEHAYYREELDININNRSPDRVSVPKMPGSRLLNINLPRSGAFAVG